MQRNFRKRQKNNKQLVIRYEGDKATDDKP